MNKKILIISYPFPPLPYSGTYRILRMCKGFSKLGIDVHVLTIDIYKNGDNDFSLLSQIPKSTIVHRTTNIDLLKSYQKIKQYFEKYPGFWFLNKIASIVLQIVNIPDNHIFWVPFAVIKGISIIKKHNINTIIVSSPPSSTFIAGYLLKKVLNIKWIADFRDPMTGNIYIDRSKKNLISPLVDNITARMEKLFVNNADVVITNTDTHQKEIALKYRTQKVFYIRNSFDANDFKGIETHNFSKFTISHIGSIYGLRNPEILFRAIKRLERDFSPIVLNLQILFVGLNEINFNHSISRLDIEKYVKDLGLISHRKAIEIMIRSNLLLLIKAKGPGAYGQIPAKFYEYLGSRRKILLIGPEESEVSTLIKELDAGYIIGDDEDMLLKVLKKEYLDFIEGNTSKITNNKICDYELNMMAKNFTNFIE